jgi:8-oxo-dGTP pyrophosphatase MutT (NUDIX family)
MSPFRPDLVDVWPFRVGAGGLELLLMRRAQGRPLAGLWQGVSGSVEEGERIAAAAFRELHEETGFDAPGLEAFYDLDLVNQFHWPPADAIVSAAVFAARVPPAAEPILSHEHDAHRWLAPVDALELVVWPAYREAIEVIERDLLDPGREPWFRLRPDGTRHIG